MTNGRHMSRQAIRFGLVSLVILLGGCGETSSHVASRAAGAASTPPPPATSYHEHSDGAPLFSVLRRTARDGDTPPPTGIQAVDIAERNHISGPVAVPASSARKLPLKPFRMWVLGHGTALCLLREISIPHGRPGFNYSCIPAQLAAQGAMVTSVAPVPSHPGAVLVEGMVPDGASALTFTSLGHRPITIRSHEGGYEILAVAPRRIAFTMNHHRRSIKIPVPPVAIVRPIA